MKTLIFNGSPRKNGDTVTLINEFISHLEGEYKIVEAYDCNIKPCIDCRYCWTSLGCSIDDEMDEVYEYLKECDNVLVASPLYFSTLSGQLLAISSRLQTYFCSRFFRGENQISNEKKGGVILVGGGDGSMDGAYDTARVLLHHMNSKNIAPLVFTHNTNTTPSKDDSLAMEGAKKLALFFNK